MIHLRDRIGNEHCAVSDAVSAQWSSVTNSYAYSGFQRATYTRAADTVWHVQTGGKAKPGLLNLCQFNGSAWEILDKRAVPPLSGASLCEITNKTDIVIGCMGNLMSNGILYKLLPNSVDLDVTPKVAGKDFYTFSVGGQKYESYFDVFVRQPWPYYPHDFPSPVDAPQGYPIYQIGVDQAGHAWWRLRTDAPMEAILQFTSTNAAHWLNSEVGYAFISNSFVSYLPPVKAGPGCLDLDNGGEANISRTYKIGFMGPGLIDGLNDIEQLYENPGTWNSSTHNCVHETIKAGNAVGVALPTDTTPEFFGFNLPPSNP